MIPTVIKVYLSTEDSSVVDVPITPHTTAADVVEFCKEPGEKECRLVERWRGNNRIVDETEKPYTLLQQWGSHGPEINFILYRNNSNNIADEAPKIHQALDESFPTIPGLNLEKGNSLPRLKEIAHQQHEQIERQEQAMAGKDQRLKYVKEQLQHHQVMIGDNEKLRRLKEKADAQEAKLKKIRMLCGKAENNRQQSVGVSSELKAVERLFNQKQAELVLAMQKVDDLTSQLDELRRGNLTPNLINGKTISFDTATDNGKTSIEAMANENNEVDTVRREMNMLVRSNEESRKRLEDQRSVLRKRNEGASELDRQIEVLTARLRQKKLTNAGYQRNNSSNSAYEKLTGTAGQAGTQAGMHTIVAAVEPLIKSSQQKNSSQQGGIYDPKQHVMNENEITNRIDQIPTTEEDSKMQELIKPNKNHVGKGDTASLTAKVQPMLQNQQQPAPFKYLNLHQQNKEGPNLYAYKEPASMQTNAASNITVLPNGNIQYLQQTPHNAPPPYHSDQYGGSGHVDPSISELRKKYSNAPRPLKKRSSITEVERPQGPNIPKFLYDKLYKQADTPYYRTNEKMSVPPPAYKEATAAAATSTASSVPTKDLEPPQQGHRKNEPPPPPPQDNTVSYESNITPKEFLKQLSNKTPESVPIPEAASSVSGKTPSFESETTTTTKDSYSPPPPLTQVVEESTSSVRAKSAVAPPAVVEAAPEADSHHQITVSCETVVPTKGILKKVKPKGPKRNIRFDPLALLLDASLEGEFELVRQVIGEVANPSGANDEGITALHNAVCAGHFDLVRFLVHYGSDVNAADTDGWTPLHCAASCNNFPMSKFLVENGACIFAATLSDGETAPDKCEENDEGYGHCYAYLRGVQEKLGRVRQGQVYALYDYTAERDDELSFSDGDLLTVIRKDDEIEDKWWWARANGQVGYIAQNLVGLWPRIKAKD